MSESCFAPSRSIPILAAETCSALGITNAMSNAAKEAGILPYSEVELSDGSFARTARLTAIPENSTRDERISILLETCLENLLAKLTVSVNPGTRIGVSVLTPKDGVITATRQLVYDRINDRLSPGMLEVAVTPVVEMSRSVFVSILPAASRAIETGNCDLYIVGAVDSLCDESSILKLAKENRLLGAENSDGIIPGEAAALICFSNPEKDEQKIGEFAGCASAVEANSYSKSNPNLADGLTTVFREIGNLIQRNCAVDFFFSSQTGERFWTDELLRAYLRNGSFMPEPFDIDLVADGFGALGVAASAVQVVRALNKQSNSSTTSLVYACDDLGECAACLVTSLPNKMQSFETETYIPVRIRLSTIPFLETRCEELLLELTSLIEQTSQSIASTDHKLLDVQDMFDRIEKQLQSVVSLGKNTWETYSLEVLTAQDDACLAGAIYTLASLSHDVHVWERIIDSWTKENFEIWRLGLYFVDETKIAAHFRAAPAPAQMPLELLELLENSGVKTRQSFDENDLRRACESEEVQNRLSAWRLLSARGTQ